jgi:hypothetical protein
MEIITAIGKVKVAATIVTIEVKVGLSKSPPLH